MAFVRFKNNQKKFVSAEQGNAIWLVMNGERPGTPQQRLFARSVDRIYLNRATAPQSYRDTYPDPHARHHVDQLALRLPYIDH